LTKVDTADAQERLRKFFELKMRYPFVTKKEKYLLPKLMGDALLSQPALSGIKPVVRIGNRTYPMANNVHTFGLKMADMDVKAGGIATVNGVEVDARVLWRALKEYCLMLYSNALAEALHMSAEKEKRGGGREYEFKATE